MANYDQYILLVWDLKAPYNICTGVKEQAYFEDFDSAWNEQKRLLSEGILCSIIRDSR